MTQDNENPITPIQTPLPEADTRQDSEPDNPKPAQPQAEPDPTEQNLMRARLAAMAQPRPTDDPELAALRQVLRDPQLMAYVTANVDTWPPMTDEQRETIAALLRRMTPDP